MSTLKETELASVKNQALTAPLPISIAPNQLWYGNDGPWSTFSLGYGTPAQYIISLASTSIPQPYVVLSEGCTSSDLSDCPNARGGIFLSNTSQSWQYLGVYTLASEENLGIYENGAFALDTIQLGRLGSMAPVVENQIVTGIAAKQFFLGALGLRPAPTNLTGLNNPIPSLIQNLKSSGKIPSLSWGYTAGAYNQYLVNKNGEASLTLGGYDASRFQASGTNFTFAPEPRDLVVAIHAIVTTGNIASLLPTPILSFIDSAVSHIWLPLSACQAFEQVFNLNYDDTLDLYLVNSTVHETLIAQNTSISLTLSDSLSLNSKDNLVTINMPYSSFDLQLTPDYPNNTKNATYYFPIRRAANESQYTLGRTFLQHAYVIADYERSTFSVNQALFPSSGAQQDLQPISPLPANNATLISLPSNASNPSLSTAALIGILVAAGVICIALITGSYFAWRRRRRHKARAVLELHGSDVLRSEPDSKGRLDAYAQELDGRDVQTPELPEKTRGIFYTSELTGDDSPQELP